VASQSVCSIPILPPVILKARFDFSPYLSFSHLSHTSEISPEAKYLFFLTVYFSYFPPLLVFLSSPRTKHDFPFANISTSRVSGKCSDIAPSIDRASSITAQLWDRLLTLAPRQSPSRCFSLCTAPCFLSPNLVQFYFSLLEYQRQLTLGKRNTSGLDRSRRGLDHLSSCILRMAKRHFRGRPLCPRRFRRHLSELSCFLPLERMISFRLVNWCHIVAVFPIAYPFLCCTRPPRQGTALRWHQSDLTGPDLNRFVRPFFEALCLSIFYFLFVNWVCCVNKQGRASAEVISPLVVDVLLPSPPLLGRSFFSSTVLPYRSRFPIYCERS